VWTAPEGNPTYGLRGQHHDSTQVNGKPVDSRDVARKALDMKKGGARRIVANDIRGCVSLLGNVHNRT